MQLSLFQSLFGPPVPKPTPGETIRELLNEYLPPDSLDPVCSWFSRMPVSLKITRNRKTKSGDFRTPYKGRPALITINGTLNPFAFLITLVHEMAHYEVFLRKKRGKPHGKAWKIAFQNLMTPYLGLPVFPEPVHKLLEKHMQNPRASTFSDHALSRALMGYDPEPEGITIETLRRGTLFTTSGGMIFRKGEKLRKRYRCIRISDQRIYLFSPMARIHPVKG